MQSETVLSCRRSCSGRRRSPAERRVRVSAGRWPPEGARRQCPLPGLSRCVLGCGPGGAAGNHVGSPEGAGFRLHQRRSLLAPLYSVSSSSRWPGGQCNVPRGSQKVDSEPGESCVAAPGPTPFPGSASPQSPLTIRVPWPCRPAAQHSLPGPGGSQHLHSPRNKGTCTFGGSLYSEDLG